VPIYNSDLLVNVDVHPGFKSGRYYLHTPFVSTITNTTAGLDTNSLTYTPLFLPKRVILDRLGIRISAARSGSLARIGIYNNSSEGLPSNLLLDAGELNTSAVGFKESTINLSLNAGWYWLAANSNSLPPNIQISNAFFGSLHFLGSSAPTATSDSYCYSQASVVYGALPSVAPINSLTVQSNIPLFWLRIA
jgi:hypothetical protein